MGWKFLKKRRGELSTQQIILLIILIASFLIILFFLFRLNLSSESDREICHNSVVTRGSSVVPSESVPLKCSRSYICITKDGTCEGMTDPEIKKVKTETEVYAVLAEDMADCWWMYGAGQIDYVQNDLKKNHYCSICSQILFDDSLNEIKDSEGNPSFEEGKISKDELYNFLTIADYSSDDGQTYSQYLFGTNNLENLKKEFSQDEDVELSFGNIEIGKQYYDVMGIVSEISVWKLALVGAGLGVVVAVVAPVGLIGGAIIVGSGGAVGGVIGDDVSELFQPEILGVIVEGDGIDNQFLAPTIIEVDAEKFEALNCKSVVSLN